MTAVTLDELRDLFTGVPAEDGGWQTTPSYTVALALEIAKRTDAQSDYTLRTVLYDTTAADDIPGIALDVIRLGVERYRQFRAEQRLLPRGL